MDTLSLESKIQLAQVTSNDHSENLDNSSVMRIGMHDIKKIYRILFTIPIYKMPLDAEIVEAKLKLTLIANGSKHTNIITPYALIENWALNTVTWYNQPALNPKIFGETINMEKKSHYVLDITPIIEKWHTNEIPNHGIILKSQEINSKTSAKMIADIRKSCGPKVEIFFKSKCSCELTPTKFIDKTEELDTNDSYCFSEIRNTSLLNTVIFFVENLEMHEITAHLQVSPDGVNFINEPTKISVEKNKIKFIVPCIFAKFTRVAVKNICCNETSRVKIWYQAQE